MPIRRRSAYGSGEALAHPCDLRLGTGCRAERLSSLLELLLASLDGQRQIQRLLGAEVARTRRLSSARRPRPRRPPRRRSSPWREDVGLPLRAGESGVCCFFALRVGAVTMASG